LSNSRTGSYQEWNSVRKPNQKELKATSIVTIPTGGAYAKIRSGSPKDDNEDLDLPVWTGELPIKQVNNHPFLQTILMRLSLSTFWNLLTAPGNVPEGEKNLARKENVTYTLVEGVSYAHIYGSSLYGRCNSPIDC
jgi:hypothetical protein